MWASTASNAVWHALPQARPNCSSPRARPNTHANNYARFLVAKQQPASTLRLRTAPSAMGHKCEALQRLCHNSWRRFRQPLRILLLRGALIKPRWVHRLKPLPSSQSPAVGMSETASGFIKAGGFLVGVLRTARCRNNQNSENKDLHPSHQRVHAQTTT